MRMILLLTCLATAVCAGGRERQRPFIAYSYSGFVNPQYDSNVRDVFKSDFANKIVIKEATGKTKVPMNQVWGFRPRRGLPCRIYEEELYTITQADTLSLYFRKTGGKYRHKTYYFSDGLNGQVRRLTARNLKEIYAIQNPEFLLLLKKELKWYEYYETYNKKRKTYRIIEIYKKTIS